MQNINCSQAGPHARGDGDVEQSVVTSMVNSLLSLPVEDRYRALLKVSTLTLAERPGTNRDGSHVQSLSDRERQVLILIANGYNRREVGSSLDITANTAARHIANIYTKLGVSTVAEAVQCAMKARLLVV